MKIAVCSDLHLEFETITLENPGDVDVLILSGDIFVEHDLLEKEVNNLDFQKSINIHNFFYDVCNKFPFVVYIAGNHEHYYGDFKKTLKEIKRKLKYLPNLQILDKETWTLHEEVLFIGGTLWTDMNKEDPLTLYSIKGVMNDFRCVRNSIRMIAEDVAARFTPEDAVEDHKNMIKCIKTNYDKSPDSVKIVVVGHHAPSKASTHPRYANEHMVNGAYSSDLTNFILDHPKIKLWTHGHTHEEFDYMIGSTRIVCNPRGYAGYEQRADMFKLKVVEI